MWSVNSKNEISDGSFLNVKRMEIPCGLVIFAKQNCVFCERLEMYLNEHNEPYTKIMCDKYLTTTHEKELFLQFMKTVAKKEWRTFPLCVNNGNFIGGCNDTISWMKYKKVDFNAFDD